MTSTQILIRSGTGTPDRLARLQLSDGGPVAGWTVASCRRRAAAWALDQGPFVATLGVGWWIGAWRLWDEGTTPGKARLGLVVFATDTRRPATRSRMVLRTLGYRSLAKVIGLCTAGIGWLYILAGVCGATRRTLYDDWSQTIVLASPCGALR